MAKSNANIDIRSRTACPQPYRPFAPSACHLSCSRPCPEIIDTQIW